MKTPIFSGVLRRLFPNTARAELAFPSPVRITSDASSFAFERSFDPAHVFEADSILLQYECLNLNLELIFSPMGAGGQAPQACARLTLAGAREDIVSYDLPELGPRANYGQVAALPQFNSIVSTFRQAAAGTKSYKPRATMTVPTALTITALSVLCTALFFSEVSTSPATNGPVSVSKGTTAAPTTTQMVAVESAGANTAAAIPEIPTTLGDQLNDVEKRLLADTVAASGIELRTGGKPFVIFSDPNCPSCRQLEAQLGSVDVSFSPVVVPVAFQRNSPEAVAAVLCSAEVAKAWKAAATGQPVATPVCEKGKNQAEANNAAFAALRFDKTPTIVTSSGKVAVGVKDFEGLMKWIKANS